MRWRMTSAWAAVAGSLALLAAGCVGPEVYRDTPERLRAEAQLRAPDLRPDEMVVPYEVDPAHVERVRALLPRFASAAVRFLSIPFSHPTG